MSSPYLLALTFIVASFTTGFDLVTSKYPGYFFLLKKSRNLYAYCLLYGFLGVIALLGLHHLIQEKYVKLESWPAIPWLQALLVGIFIKAFLHVRLGTIKEFPVGLESIVHIFEPRFLRGIDLDKHNALQSFLAPRIAAYSDLEAVKQKIIEDTPSFFDRKEKIVFRSDIEDSKTVKEAMEKYLDVIDKSGFDRLFPLA